MTEPMWTEPLSVHDARVRENEWLLIEVNRLKQVLRAVEWGSLDVDEDGQRITACPWCHWGRTQGHYPDCDLDAALKREVCCD